MTEPLTNPPAPKRRGCLFYGCLTAVVLLLIAGLMVFLAVRFARNTLDAYTDTKPMPLPKVELTDAEFQSLEERVKSFGATLKSGKPGAPLTLNEQEINALIARTANTKELADKVHVSLNGNEVKGQISIPLSGLGWVGNGRYLNGEAVFKVGLENGALEVTAQSVTVKGNPLPESFMSRLRQENLAREATQDPKSAEAIRKLQSIQVENGEVTIQASGQK